MTKASDNEFPKVILDVGTIPAAPSDGNWKLYAAAGGVYAVSSNATVGPLAAGGAGGAVATDAIWDAAGDLAVGSGADTAAKLTKGAAGGALSMINAGVAWNSGTSFPASKATGDRYWRTDLGMEFYWDGTRWVTTTLYSVPVATQTLAMTVGGYSASTTLRVADPHPTLSCYVVNFWAGTYVITTNDAAKYWTLALGGVAGSTISTVSNATAALVLESAAVGAVVAPTGWIQCDITKVSTPGALFTTPQMSYRLIAT